MPFLDKSTLTYPATNSFPGRRWEDTRDPTSSDYKQFQITDQWYNTNDQTVWTMVGRTSTSGTWVREGGLQADILTLTGDTGGAVYSDTNANVNVLGTANQISITGNPTTHTLTVAMANNQTPISNVNVDAHTAPGTDPVLATNGGQITVTGGQVAAGTIGANVIRTDSLSANTYTIEIQRSSAVASTDSTKNGVAHFNSGQFSVDSNGFVSLTGGGEAIDSFIPDSGTSPVVPRADGSVTMTGASGMSTIGGTNTLNFYAHTVAKWVVDPTANVGTHQTITAALAAASSGDDIFIRPGTYTENLTLKAGVNLVAFVGDADTPNVTIVGKCSYSAAGTTSISGIRLQTNGNYALEVSGSSASIVHLNECYLNCTNFTGINNSSSSSSAAITLENCQADLGTTGIAFATQSSPGTITLFYCLINNSGGSSTANTISAGALRSYYSFFDNPITTSGTGLLGLQYTLVGPSVANLTAVTIGGSGGGSAVRCRFTSGNQPAVVINTDFLMDDCDYDSTATNQITGSGAVTYTLLQNSSGGNNWVKNNVTTQNFGAVQLSKFTAPGQPCFDAYASADQTNVTGNGTTYTIQFESVNFDQQSNFNTGTGIFTAPVSGKYFLTSTVLFFNLSALPAATSIAHIDILTTSNNYRFGTDIGSIVQSNNTASMTITAIANLNAGDTAKVQATISGYGADTIGIRGLVSSLQQSFFSGYLIC